MLKFAIFFFFCIFVCFCLVGGDMGSLTVYVIFTFIFDSLIVKFCDDRKWVVVQTCLTFEEIHKHTLNGSTEYFISKHMEIYATNRNHFFIFILVAFYVWYNVSVIQIFRETGVDA